MVFSGLKWMAVGVTALMIGVACAGEKTADRQEQPKGSGDDVFPVVASSDLGVGKNRFLLGLLDESDAPLTLPKTHLRVGFLPPGSETVASVSEMRFVWSQKPVQGLWVGEARFSRPGEWRAVIQLQGGGRTGTVGTAFQVERETSTPDIGAKAPLTDSPTAADVGSLAEITTDPDPDRRFYESSIAQAVKAGKPAVIVFATPRFCTSQICGPTLTIVKDVSKRFKDVTFVHVEPYDLDKVPEELVPVPYATEWGLPSEPWVFVTNDRGRIAAKYEGSLSSEELARELAGLTG